METDYDVIVVGAGSAGCVVAGRLAAETDARVLVLENGGRDSSPLIRIPAGFSMLLAKQQFVYPNLTTPQAHLNGRQLNVFSGRGLGGGSSINGMVWIWGQEQDYEGWQAAVGDTGDWRMSDLLPYFRAMESNADLSGPRHGVDGPMGVSSPHQIAPINQAAIRAFQEMGLPYNADYNSGDQRGVGPVQLIIGKDAHRNSAAHAYLHPAETRDNLTVSTGCMVTRLLIDGDRVQGVEYVQDGRLLQATAGEVVLSAGAFRSPQIMMLSGIGSEEELRRHGIEVKARSEEVGRNLHDHPLAIMTAESKEDLGYTGATSLIGTLEAGIQYLTTHTGPAASNGVETVAHFDPDDLSAEPTIQCLHAAVVVEATLQPPSAKPGLSLEAGLLRPKSRGTVTLHDADPASLPVIDPAYLSHPDDMRAMVSGLRYIRDVFDAPSLAKVLKPEGRPSVRLKTDADLAEHARNHTSPDYHPCGTCRMGSDDAAVVDADLRVRGVRGLRVIDASIMPNIVSANTMAATMAIAQKGVDLMKTAFVR